MSKRNKPANGNGKPSVRDDLGKAESSFWRAERILRTAYKAIDHADEERDGEGVTEGIAVLRIGLDDLRSAIDELDRVGGRLFREGQPPEDLKKLERESTPPAIHILRSLRTPAQKVKALQKLEGVRPS